MREVELKLISELVKNSRRSDRDLAKTIGISQPTVTRLRTRLEKEGYIKEYTMIPDFAKLGYEILAITFIKLKKALSQEEAEKARETTRQKLIKSRFGTIMLERGMGLGYDGVIVSFYKNYSNYMEHMNTIKEYALIELAEIDSFIINLKDEIQYRPITFSFLANLLLEMQEKEKKQE
jgi:DNA-binding Lrp family transcriptional regulator